MLKYRRDSRTYYKMKLCAKGIFSCPLLNICASKLKQSFTEKFTCVFQECEKIALKQMAWSFVSMFKAVRWNLFLNVKQLIKRESENLRCTLIVPISCLTFGK